MADTHTYKFNVSMSCSGCSGAVDRVLKKLEGKSAPVRSRSQSSPLQPTLSSTLPPSIHRRGRKGRKDRDAITGSTQLTTCITTNRRRVVRGLPREPDRHRRGQGRPALREGARDHRQDGQEGQHGRGRRRGAERRGRCCCLSGRLPVGGTLLEMVASGDERGVGEQLTPWRRTTWDAEMEHRQEVHV